MNTLSKEITLSRFYQEDPDKYAEIKTQWSKMVNSELNVTLTMSHHILYLILIGKNWQKAVTLPTNKNKLENHYKPKIEDVKQYWGSTFRKANVLHSFAGLVTEEMYSNAWKITELDMAKEPYRDSDE